MAIGGRAAAGRPSNGCAQVTRTGSAAGRVAEDCSAVTGSTGQGARVLTQSRVLAVTARGANRGVLPITSRSAPRSRATVTITGAGSPATRMVFVFAPRGHATRRAWSRTGWASGSSSCRVIGSVGASRPTRYSTGATTCRISELSLERAGEVRGDRRRLSGGEAATSGDQHPRGLRGHASYSQLIGWRAPQQL